MQDNSVLNVPASDIDSLKSNVVGALADINSSAWVERTVRAAQVETARKIIADVPRILRQQATLPRSGDPHAVTKTCGLMPIMLLQEQDHDEERLTGVAQIVFDSCEQAGLTPVVSLSFHEGDHWAIFLPVNAQGMEGALRQRARLAAPKSSAPSATAREQGLARRSCI